MLVVALAMVVNSACSHAPREETAKEPSSAQGTLLLHQNEHVVVRIHTADGTIYVTSRYAVTDSFVVVSEILRGEKYYPEMNEPHLYGKPDPVKQPAEDVILPVEIPSDQLVRVERWEEKHPTRSGIVAGVLIVGGVLLVATLIWLQVDFVLTPN